MIVAGAVVANETLEQKTFAQCRPPKRVDFVQDALPTVYLASARMAEENVKTSPENGQTRGQEIAASRLMEYR